MVQVGDDLKELLSYLVGLGREVEHVEFKENNHTKEIVGELISGISNSACLSGVPFGYLVFGVRDASIEVVGTSFKPSQEKVGNEDLELWLAKMLDPSIQFVTHEFEYESKHIVIYQIWPATARPVRFQGQAYIRIGPNNRKLVDFPDREAEIWKKSARTGYELASGVDRLSVDQVLDLLDYTKYFELTKKQLPATPDGIVEALISEQFVKFVEGWGYTITNLGGILFAKDLNSFPTLKRKAPRVIVYTGTSKESTIKESEGKKGYAAGFERLIEYINDQLPSNEEITKSLRSDRKMYPEIAIRELVANALIHQDLMERGTGPTFEIFKDRIEISNPGKPLISADRFIDHKPQSRNEQLAAFMRRIGVCEERGSGIDKVLSYVEIFQLPAPKFEEADKYLRVTMFAPRDVRDMSREDRVRACYQHASLRYVSNDVMSNSSLRERFKLSDSKTDQVFTSNMISEAMKIGVIKPQGDPGARRGAKYVPYWA